MCRAKLDIYLSKFENTEIKRSNLASESSQEKGRQQWSNGVTNRSIWRGVFGRCSNAVCFSQPKSECKRELELLSMQGKSRF